MDDAMNTALSGKEKMLVSGFVAQEVENSNS